MQKKETSRFSENLQIYTPKHLKKGEEKPGNLSFKRLESTDAARTVLYFLLLSTGKQIKSGHILDKINRAEIPPYYTLGLHNYFDEEHKHTSKHYRNGYYNEGRKLLMQFRNRKKKPINRILKKSNEDICQILAADLHLKTARQNAKRGHFRCQNVTVPFLGIDVETKEFTYTSNYTTKLLSSCTLKNSAENHNKKFSAAENAGICYKACGKEPDGCAERNFLKKIEHNNFINAQTALGIFDYDDDHYASCKACDAALGRTGFPIYMSLAQPNTVFVNQEAPLYRQVIKEILSIASHKSQSRD